MTVAPAEVLERPCVATLRRKPFPHIVARNVFSRRSTTRRSSARSATCSTAASRVADRGRFSRNLPGYDAYGIGIGPGSRRPDVALPVAGVARPARRIWDVGRTPYVFAGAHHHAPGSESGFIHNDFNPVWFPRSANGAIQIPNQDVCSYKTGAGTARRRREDRGRARCRPDPLPRERHLAARRRRRDGSVRFRRCPVGEPRFCVAAREQLADQLRVHAESFHGFIGNTRIARTSIIMWVHRPLEEAVSCYGAERLERWES